MDIKKQILGVCLMGIITLIVGCGSATGSPSDTSTSDLNVNTVLTIPSMPSE